MAARIRAHELAARRTRAAGVVAAGADADPVQLAAAEAELRAVNATLPTAREAFRLAEEAAAARARADELGAREAALRRAVIHADAFEPALTELVALVVATAPGPMGAPW